MRACAYAGTTYNIRAVSGRDACCRKRGGGGCVPMPGQRRLAFNILKSFTFTLFSSMYLSTIFIFSSRLSHGHSKRKNDFWVVFLLHVQKKKRTGLSARPTTGQSPKFKLKSFTFMSFSSMYSSTASYLFEWVLSRQLKTGI